MSPRLLLLFSVVFVSFVLSQRIPIGSEREAEFSFGEGVDLWRDPRHPIDPDSSRTMCGIIQDKGYSCEEHYVTTKDGYILGMFRIPGNGPPILLQHGLEDSSFSWVLNYPGQSFPYILSDLGYDVWFGNSRGNTYSKNHTTLSVNDDEFWQFSWDQMAIYDFPAQIEYAISENGNYSKLVYVGHSQGTTQAFAGLAHNSTIASLLYGFAGLGPVVQVTHMTNLWLKELARLGMVWIWNVFGINQFLPTPVVLHEEFVWFCADCPICCNSVVELICGRHHGAFNNSRMNVMSGHEPGGTSVQNIHHWTQMVRNNDFQMLNYGRHENRKHYGQPHPPKYDLTKIPSTLPMALYSGTRDELADPQDVQLLIDQLQPIIKSLYWKEIDKYAHLDFVWALDAPDQIYNELTGMIASWISSQ